MPKSLCLVGVFLLAVATTLVAQGPPGGRGARGGRDPQDGRDVVAASVAKMMAFDADEDGKLSKSEVTDPRLVPLFERADADQDGVVTREELTALFQKEAQPAGGPSFGGFGPPPGGGRAGGPPRGAPPPGPDGGPPPEGLRRFGESGPPGGPPPRPGEILPGFVQDELQLTRRQRAQLEKLQQDVDARLAKILTEEQRERLNEMSRRGPGGPPPMLPRVAPPEGAPPRDNPPAGHRPPRRPRNSAPPANPPDAPPQR